MGIVDFILNLAGLLLWLNWRAVPFDPAVSPSRTGALLSTIKKAGSSTRTWIFLAGCALIVLIRAVFYWQIGPKLGWHPAIPLILLNPVFRSDLFERILTFSALSFILTIALFYHWLLLLSVINNRLPDTDPIQRWVRLQLGWTAHLPFPIRLVVPFFAGMTGWCALSPLLTALNIQPAAKDFGHVLQQSVFLGAAIFFAWKYLLIAVLALHLINSHVYLGAMTIWNYINHTSRMILWPISWLPLQFGRIDFSPVVMMALIFLLGELPNTEFMRKLIGPFLF